jgi:hypothetical protein
MNMLKIPHNALVFVVTAGKHCSCEMTATRNSPISRLRRYLRKKIRPLMSRAATGRDG